MGLAQVQAALARLYTDPAARTQLAETPDQFARNFQLNPKELELLNADLSNCIESFALNLIHKRRREAAHSIPATRQLLGTRFSAAFHAFALASPGSAASPAHDALSFLRWLPSALEYLSKATLRDSIRYESISLTMRLSGSRFAAGFFTLPSPLTQSSLTLLAFWWRWPSLRLHHRSWKLPKGMWEKFRLKREFVRHASTEARNDWD